MPAFKENSMQSRILIFLALVVLTADVARAQLATPAVDENGSPAAVDSYAAYSVYYYDSQGNGHGMAGSITDTGSTINSTPNLNTGLNGSPTVQGFPSSNGTPYIAVTDYTGAAGQPISIYNATTDKLVKNVKKGWADVANLFSMVQVGSYFYALDYDTGNVVEINSTTYAQTGNIYTPAPVTTAGTTYYPHGQMLLNIDGVLYGLFTYANSGFTTYTNSAVVEFTIVGGSSIGVASSNSKFAQNAFAMAVTGSKVYVAAVGGTQNGGSYNAKSCIESIPYDKLSGSITTVMKSSSTYPYNFLDISFNGTTAYILMGAYNSDYTLNTGKLLSTTNFRTFTTIDDFSSGVAGYYWAAQYTSNNNRIWYARGNSIWAYNASSTGTPAAELTFTTGSGSTGLLISSGESYNTLSNFSYVGASGSRALHGYRSPIQASQTPWAVRARAIAQGRPELTQEEIDRLNSEQLNGAF